MDAVYSERHATLDIALVVTCGPSCLTALWRACVKGKTALGFPSVSPWTSETLQWKLSTLQLICCRCWEKLVENITWGVEEKKSHNSSRMGCHDLFFFSAILHIDIVDAKLRRSQPSNCRWLAHNFSGTLAQFFHIKLYSGICTAYSVTDT